MPKRSSPEREIDPMAFDTSPPAPMQKPEPVARIPVTADVDEIEEQDDLTPERGGWVISLVCIGVAIIAACLLLPLAEENHQLAWQREKLKTDLTQIQQQVKVNEEFLGKIEKRPHVGRAIGPAADEIDPQRLEDFRVAGKWPGRNLTVSTRQSASAHRRTGLSTARRRAVSDRAKSPIATLFDRLRPDAGRLRTCPRWRLKARGCLTQALPYSRPWAEAPGPPPCDSHTQLR